MIVGLVDYSKAFDSVEIPKVIEALQIQGIDTVYIEVLKHIYQQAKSFIRLHADSEPFQLGRGVRQGDTSSPKLFTAVLEEVFKNLDWDRNGINIDGEFLNHLRFADDIIVIAKDPQELEKMLKELNEESLKVGLKMNLSKTKIMKNDHINQEISIKINDDKIEVVQNYIYLGQNISLKSTSKSEEIKRRITIGWQAFGRAGEIFRNKNIPLIQKRQIYNQCILPAVTYGAETWNLTKQETLKLRTMQRAHERIMLNINWRDRKTAKWIRSQTKVRDVMEVISDLKWKWAGHVARRFDNRWTTKVTVWTPIGYTRSRGRPKTRWRDDIEKLDKYWHRSAQDRNKWREMGKAYVQQRTLIG